VNALPALDAWVAAEARIATARMLEAISATHRVMVRPGFGQRVIPGPGSVLASPVPAHYDPDPDYFFHWFRDSALVIDALRVALLARFAEPSAVGLFREFLEFTRSLSSLDGREFLRQSNFRARVQPAFLQYVRPDAELAALSGEAVSADVRVNADGTPDFIRWSRPQNDGPALRALALLRWWHEFPQLRSDRDSMSALRGITRSDLAFALAHANEPCGDLWEEESGYHYYTQLVLAEALTRGAAWLEAGGESGAAAASRSAAEETLTCLDGLWSAAEGFYRSRTVTGSSERRQDPNIAVILAALHAGRAGGRHAVLDPRTQATLTALEELFEAEYPINRERPADRGPALGRYRGDRYYGGGAWFLATLAAAEFYFTLARSLCAGAEMPVVPANARFRVRLGASGAAAREMWVRLAIERGDAIMRTVQAFTPASGELSEQFDRVTGAQTSAKQLSWSYAAFITAAASRAQALQPIRGADHEAQPADTA
jgi:glucoamylase